VINLTNADAASNNGCSVYGVTIIATSDDCYSVQQNFFITNPGAINANGSVGYLYWVQNALIVYDGLSGPSVLDTYEIWNPTDRVRKIPGISNYSQTFSLSYPSTAELTSYLVGSTLNLTAVVRSTQLLDVPIPLAIPSDAFIWDSPTSADDNGLSALPQLAIVGTGNAQATFLSQTNGTVYSFLEGATTSWSEGVSEEASSDSDLLESSAHLAWTPALGQGVVGSDACFTEAAGAGNEVLYFASVGQISATGTQSACGSLSYVAAATNGPPSTSVEVNSVSPAGVDVSVQGTGTGTVIVGQTGIDFVAPTAFPNSGFFDVQALGDPFTEVDVDACGIGDAVAIDWWNPSAWMGRGAWLPASDEAATTEGQTRCLDTTITASTTPSLSQLTGTIFAIQAPSPTAVKAIAVPMVTVQGRPVVFAAVVRSEYAVPTGTVTFEVGSSELCTATLQFGFGWCASSKAPVGTDSVIAAYSGDRTHLASIGTTPLVVYSERMTTRGSGSRETELETKG
jgi:hypothetical protein